jgi:hypothetical protein
MAQGAEVDEYEIPRSRGVPPVVLWLFAVGVVLIVFMGAITVVQAQANHYDPPQDVPKITLSGSLV